MNQAALIVTALLEEGPDATPESARLAQAVSMYRRRRRGLGVPRDPASETRECCQGVPAGALWRHVRTGEHVANLCGVSLDELRTAYEADLKSSGLRDLRHNAPGYGTQSPVRVPIQYRDAWAKSPSEF